MTENALEAAKAYFTRSWRRRGTLPLKHAEALLAEIHKLEAENTALRQELLVLRGDNARRQLDDDACAYLAEVAAEFAALRQERDALKVSMANQAEALRYQENHRRDAEATIDKRDEELAALRQEREALTEAGKSLGVEVAALKAHEAGYEQEVVMLRRELGQRNAALALARAVLDGCIAGDPATDKEAAWRQLWVKEAAWQRWQEAQR